MTFSISITETSDPDLGRCELVIGDHKEIFPIVTSLWSTKMYCSQWKQALIALLSDEVQSCALVTDIQAPEASHGIAYWVLFREGNSVHFQERFSRKLRDELCGSAAVAESHIPPRMQGTAEDFAQVSEWTIPIGALRKFIH